MDNLTPYDLDSAHRGAVIVSEYKDPHRHMTLQEVGDILGLSPERVRQIELGAFRKIRREFRKRGIDADLVHEYLMDIRQTDLMDRF